MLRKAERKGVINIIVKMHDHKKFPAKFDEIAGTLNELGYETVRGKEFTPSNVRAKYKARKKEASGK